MINNGKYELHYTMHNSYFIGQINTLLFQPFQPKCMLLHPQLLHNILPGIYLINVVFFSTPS
jgi:hypothetical protein